MKEVNYTEAQVAEMEALGSIDNATAQVLADKFGKTVASVRAKAVRMGIYVTKERTSKNGDAIETKEDIVKDIADLVGQSMDGLVKASKVELKALRTALAA